MTQFYIAGPFFNCYEIEVVNIIKNKLESLGFEVFSPMHKFMCPPTASPGVRKDTFDGNLVAIEDSDYIIVITDNKDLGTLFEAGYAYKCNKKIIYFSQTLGNNPFNLMLAQSGICITTSYERLFSVLSDIKNNIPIDSKFSGQIE